ncbi:MAG: nucleotide exchange factor GrpE [Planctomycetota bacterium]
MNEEEKEYKQDDSRQEATGGKREIPIRDGDEDQPREQNPEQEESAQQRAEETPEDPEQEEQTAETDDTEESGEDQEKDEVTISFAEYEELETLAQERDEYLQRLQRAVADYQNLQKRLKKERKRAYENGVKETLEHILPLADTLTRARQAAEQSEKPEDMLEGLKLIEKEFYDSLERFDVEPVKSVNEPFDPHYHHAVMQQPSDEVPPQTVIDEIKKGFVRGDEVIRPAQVSVSVEPQTSDDEDAEEDEGEDQ